MDSVARIKRVLVVGGAGYIGSHTCKALSLAGIEPIVFDNLVTGHRRAAKWGPLVIGDLTASDLDRAFKTFKPDAVIHFAAHAYVGESVTAPDKYYRNNVSGSLALFDAACRAGVQAVVFSSSCATYGVPVKTPITEDAPQRPISPYGWSKFMVERILADYSSAFGLSFVALRYFNACGADPDGEIGEWHDPETHIIPRALLAAKQGSPPFMVFGEDYQTADGTCVRDFIHVSDLAQGHVQALGLLDKPGQARYLNLGTGKGHSVREVLHAIGRVIGRPVPTVAGPRRAGDPPILVADVSAAREQLAFVARYSDIETIVRTALPFFR